MSEPTTPQINNNELKVLDKGFVKLVDFMGDDARVVQAARVSYGPGTKTLSEDAGLIDYLMRNQHTSPFEKVRFEFHVKLPIFLARQWMRHRTGSFNEISARYSDMKDEFYIPEEWRAQSKTNKQVSAGRVPTMDALVSYADYEEVLKMAYLTYQGMINRGVAREQARMVLPVSLYTEFYWTVDLHNLLRFIGLRWHKHAQWEVQQYAAALYVLIKGIVPLTIRSWENHFLYGENFSSQDILFLREVLDTWYDFVENKSLDADLNDKGYSRRQRDEFIGKLYGGNK